jgi:transposase-like protein
MSNKQGATIYSESFKWKVVQEVLRGRMSKEEARVAYGIKGNCSILYWMRKFSGNEDYRSIHTFCARRVSASALCELKNEICISNQIFLTAKYNIVM